MNKQKITSENYDEQKSNINQNNKTKNKSKAQKAVPILIVSVVKI